MRFPVVPWSPGPSHLTLLVLALTHLATANHSSFLQAGRTPRVTGRIVKLYSHPRQEGFRCTSDGFQADPNNCAVFYRCEGRTTYKFQCGPGTVYDPETGICNFPSNTRRVECGGNKHLAPLNTGRSRENEIDSDEPVQPPPSPISTKITKMSDLTTAMAKLTTKAIPWTSAFQQTTDRVNTAPKYKPVTILSHAKSSDSRDECTSNGFMGDSKDCKKFYRCVPNGRGYIRYEFSCSDATVWDDNIQACNHAWAARNRCGRNEADGDNETALKVNTDNLIQNSVNVSNNQYKHYFGQRVNQNPMIQKHSQIKHTTTMSQTQKTVIIENRIKQIHAQPNQKKQSSPIPSWTIPSKQGYSEPDDDAQSDTYETPSPQTSTEAQSLNDNKCRESGFMGDSKDCKKFYRCVDNGRGSYTRYEFSCGEGTVWDSNSQACNHAWAVKNCGENSKDDVNEVDQSTKEDSSTSTTTPKNTQATTQTTTEDINDYDQGYGGQPIKQPTQDQTEPSSTTTTTERNKPSTNKDNQCTSSGFMGDSGDCKKFYRCVDNSKGGYIRYEFSCGEGTVWDQSLEACNHAWAVKECGGKQSDNEENVEQATHTSQQETSVITTIAPTTEANTGEDDLDQGYGPSTSKPIETSTTKFTESSSGDECEKEGFKGDNKDCKKFYRCVSNGKGGFLKYDFSCGEGTLWDSDIDACNHKNAVKRPCSDVESQSVEETTEPQSSTTSKPSTTEQPQNIGSTETTETGEKEPEGTTKSPSHPSSTCNGEGFIGDKNDCMKFYRCVDNGKGGYTKYEFSCGDGTVWDQDIQSCNHESMVKTCGSSTSTSIQTSTTESEIDSGYGPEPEHDEIQPEKTTTQQPSPTEMTTNSIKSPQTDDKCSSEGFYQDSKDCKKFYRCVDNGRGGYSKYDFTCGEGTIWDQEIQACNHPIGGKSCITGLPEADKPVTESSTQKESFTTSNPEGATDASRPEGTTAPYQQEETNGQPVTGRPTESRGKCTSEGFYADESDCKKFYRCVDNGKNGYTKYEFTCGDGTAWDQEIQGCNFESSVNSCGKGGESSSTMQTIDTSEQQPETPNNPDNSHNEQTTERLQDEYKPVHESSTSKNPQTSGGETAGQCTSEGFHPNENNCKKFYRCVDNGKDGYTRYDFECGEGTAWDQEGQTCNYEDQVNCQSSQESGSKPETPPQNDEQDSTDSSASESNSQNPTSESSAQSSSTSKQPPPSESSSSNGKCEKEGYFGNTEDCKKFYRCVDNGKGGYTKYDFDCGEGTMWDQDLQTCNHPGDVKNPSCQNTESQSSTTSSPSKTTQESSSSSTITDSSSGTTQLSSGTTEQSSDKNCTETTSKPTSSNITCPEAGFYPNPDDCKKFYRCVDYEGDGKSYTVFHFDCGEGTIWDPNLDTCNYEDSINPPRDCSKKTQQQEVESESTTMLSTETESTTTQKSSTQEQATTQSQTTTTQRQETTTEQETTTSKTTTQQETTTEQQASTQQSTTEKSTTTQQSTTQQDTTTQSQTTTTQQETTTQQQQTTTQQTTTTQQETTTQSTTQAETSTNPTTQQQMTESQTTTEQQTDGTTQTQDDNTTEGQQPTTEAGESTTEAGESTTEAGQSTTEAEQSTTESSTDETTTESSSSNEQCPETDDDQYLYVCPTGFRRHPKYCNLFYQCSEDDSNHDVKVAVFNCPNNTIYDETKNQCVDESEADKKCEGQKAERRRFKRLDDTSKPPISINNGQLRCPAKGHFPFEKTDECSPAFLKCQQSKSSPKLRGYVYKCPDNYVYWAVSRRCERASKMKGCSGVDNSWKGRWEIPVEKFNVAP